MKLLNFLGKFLIKKLSSFVVRDSNCTIVKRMWLADLASRINESVDLIDAHIVRKMAAQTGRTLEECMAIYCNELLMRQSDDANQSIFIPQNEMGDDQTSKED